MKHKDLYGALAGLVVGLILIGIIILVRGPKKQILACIPMTHATEPVMFTGTKVKCENNHCYIDVEHGEYKTVMHLSIDTTDMICGIEDK